MADFYGTLLSTSFRVKNREAFLAEPAVKMAQSKAQMLDGFFMEEKGYWAFGWSDAWPSPDFSDAAINDFEQDHFDDDRDPAELEAARRVLEQTDFDLLSVLQDHIHPEDMCRVQVSGRVKLRSNGGWIWYVTSKGILTVCTEAQYDQRLTVRDLDYFSTIVKESKKIR